MEAMQALLTTRPTTAAGCIAVLRYVAEYCTKIEATLFHDWIDPWNTAGQAFFPLIADAVEELAVQS
jgi:hypothetical protein